MADAFARRGFGRRVAPTPARFASWSTSTYHDQYLSTNGIAQLRLAHESDREQNIRVQTISVSAYDDWTQGTYHARTGRKPK